MAAMDWISARSRISLVVAKSNFGSCVVVQLCRSKNSVFWRSRLLDSVMLIGGAI